MFLTISSTLGITHCLKSVHIYSEFLWCVFSRIRTEYGEILMRGNTDQKNSEYGHFSYSDRVK